jgi:hypothetical protein
MGHGVMSREAAERRARRLLRWYPNAWRLRYGEEFTQLLIADIVERPRSLRRTLDVAGRGLAARVAPRRAVAGLVLVATLVVCSWIIGTLVAAPSNPTQVACGTHCTPQVVAHLRRIEPWRQRILYAPDRAIPLAVGIGVAGAGLAFLILRPPWTKRVA